MDALASEANCKWGARLILRNIERRKPNSQTHINPNLGEGEV